VNFLQALRQVLSKYADFSGRARRSELWWWMLAITVASAALSGVDSALPYPFLQPTFALLVLVPTGAVGTRRLHDTGRSGWWLAFWFGTLVVAGGVFLLSSLAALVGLLELGFGGDSDTGGMVLVLGSIGMMLSALALLAILGWATVWLAQSGEAGPNRFGEAPR